MIDKFLKGVNRKSFFVTVVVMFIYIVVTDMIIHGGILKHSYMETSYLWRPEANMHAHMWIMLLGQLIIAKFFVFIFIVGYQGKGWQEGARYGFLVGMLQAGGMLITYSVQPLTHTIISVWIIAGLLQSIFGGMLAAKVYKK